MVSLALIHLFGLASGWSVSLLLPLPTPLLRWTIALAAGCGQLLLSAQILSLFHQLNGTGLLIGNGLIACALVWITIYRHRGHESLKLYQRPELGFRRLASEFGRINVLFGALVLMAFAIVALAGHFQFPATDPYHINMCLFWRQHESIQSFLVHDPRAVSVVFASEVLAFPWILYTDSHLGFIACTLAAAFLIAWLLYALALGIGASRRTAFVVSLVFCSSTTALGSIVGSKSDFLLSTLWLLGSLHCLFEIWTFPKRKAALIGSSAFLFAMACGAKNTILLHAPAYGLALLLILGRPAVQARFLARIFFFGLVGMLVSGVIWSYVQNQFWLGDWRGHWFVRETLARDYSLVAVWTRLTRGFATIAYDCGWLPGSLQTSYARLVTATVQVMGGASILPEDKKFYSFDPAFINVGSGMGAIGPIVVIPSLAAAVLLAWRHRLSRSDDTDRFRALTVFAVVSLIIFYAVLRTQTIGVTRLMASCIAIAMPLSVLVLRTRVGYWIGMSAATFSLLLNCGNASRYALNQVGPNLFPVLTKLKRTTLATVEIQWYDSPRQPAAIREPHFNREVYRMVSDRIERANVVGLVGGFNASGYFCFGSNFSKRVAVLKDCRSQTIERPGRNVDCIIVENFNPQQIDPAVLYGFKRVFEASRNGKTLLACYERNSESEPGLSEKSKPPPQSDSINEHQ
jgi:hypothetical protein